MKSVLLLGAVVLSGAFHVARAQSNCAQTLRLAQSIYEQGRLHELPVLLSECMRSGFNDEERVAAYKLLALTYIYLEEPAKADTMMLALLRTDTEYKVNPTLDPAEFVALYKTFRTAPVYRIGGKLGATATRPSVVSGDYVDDGTNSISRGYGFCGRLSVEVPLTGKMRKFTLNPEIAFQMLSFNSAGNGADTARTAPAAERHTWLSLPVSLQYTVFGNEQGTTAYYVSGGFSADYLLNASKNISSNIEYNSGVKEGTAGLHDERKSFNAGATLSAGFKRKIGKGFMVFELRYKMGLLTLSDRSDTYENQVLVFDYKYVDGIYRLNTLSVSAGYLLNRYKPKKLTSR